MRVFISIEFDEIMKDYLEEIQNKIKNKSTKGRFHARDNFHLTLKFIGEVNKEKISDIETSIDKVVSDKEAFTLVLNELGRFPRKNKNIIWIGISKNIKLELLVEELENELEKIGIAKEERKFKAHITLGRNIVLKEEFNELYDEIDIDNITLKVDEISLMESKNVDGELKYIPIYKRQIN